MNRDILNRHRVRCPQGDGTPGSSENVLQVTVSLFVAIADATRPTSEPTPPGRYPRKSVTSRHPSPPFGRYRLICYVVTAKVQKPLSGAKTLRLSTDSGEYLAVGGRCRYPLSEWTRKQREGRPLIKDNLLEGGQRVTRNPVGPILLATQKDGSERAPTAPVVANSLWRSGMLCPDEMASETISQAQRPFKDCRTLRL